MITVKRLKQKSKIIKIIDFLSCRPIKMKKATLKKWLFIYVLRLLCRRSKRAKYILLNNRHPTVYIWFVAILNCTKFII